MKARLVEATGHAEFSADLEIKLAAWIANNGLDELRQAVALAEKTQELVRAELRVDPRTFAEPVTM